MRGSDGRLAIAKFPRDADTYSVGAWEHLALELAGDAGIDTAEAELCSMGDREVLLLPRFDRRGEIRVPFLSAMSLLDAVDGESRSYLEIAEVIRRIGAAARSDLRELWRRLVFNVLVSNTDDTSASLDLAFEVAPYFDMEEDEARAVAREIVDVTVHWAERARSNGIPGPEIDLMSSAFEHEDLDAALGSSG